MTNKIKKIMIKDIKNNDKNIKTLTKTMTKTNGIEKSMSFPQSSVISNTKKNPNFSTLVKHLDIGNALKYRW